LAYSLTAPPRTESSQIQANRFGPAHLWFLAYLIPMLALLGVVQSWCRERPRSLHCVLSRFCSPLTPLMLAIPTTLILWLGYGWNGVDSILDLRNSFLINPIRWSITACSSSRASAGTRAGLVCPR
jgi:hypothetical protein